MAESVEGQFEVRFHFLLELDVADSLKPQSADGQLKSGPVRSVRSIQAACFAQASR